MNPNERLTQAAILIKDQDTTGILDEMKAEELARLAVDTDIKEDDFPLLAGITVYIRKRISEKCSRPIAFEQAFPERCIYQGKEGAFASTLSVGDKLHKTTMDIKAKRLEASALYKKVYAILQTGLYVSYAVDRLRVLDEALKYVFDDHVADRDKAVYMKLFLEETRKPDNAKDLEINFNLTQNNVSIASVEDKMNSIAQALNHASAAEVIEMVHQKDPEDGN